MLETYHVLMSLTEAEVYGAGSILIGGIGAMWKALHTAKENTEKRLKDIELESKVRSEKIEEANKLRAEKAEAKNESNEVILRTMAGKMGVLEGKLETAEKIHPRLASLTDLSEQILQAVTTNTPNN